MVHRENPSGVPHKNRLRLCPLKASCLAQEARREAACPGRETWKVRQGFKGQEGEAKLWDGWVGGGKRGVNRQLLSLAIPKL